MTYLPSLPNGSLIDMIIKYPQYSGPLHQFLEAALRTPNGQLNPAQRETIFAYVSGLNGCEFCCASHTGVAEALGAPKGLISDLLSDIPVPHAESTLRPIFNYVKKLTLVPASIEKADVDAMITAGWTEDTVMNATMICCAANFFNRWVEGGGVTADAKMVNAGIKMLVENGYALNKPRVKAR